MHTKKALYQYYELFQSKLELKGKKKYFIEMHEKLKLRK